jgi:hypothetical protein
MRENDRGVRVPESWRMFRHVDRPESRNRMLIVAYLKVERLEGRRRIGRIGDPDYQTIEAGGQRIGAEIPAHEQIAVRAERAAIDLLVHFRANGRVEPADQVVHVETFAVQRNR